MVQDADIYNDCISGEAGPVDDGEQEKAVASLEKAGYTTDFAAAEGGIVMEKFIRYGGKTVRFTAVAELDWTINYKGDTGIMRLYDVYYKTDNGFMYPMPAFIRLKQWRNGTLSPDRHQDRAPFDAVKEACGFKGRVTVDDYDTLLEKAGELGSGLEVSEFNQKNSGNGTMERRFTHVNGFDDGTVELGFRDDGKCICYGEDGTTEDFTGTYELMDALRNVRSGVWKEVTGNAPPKVRPESEAVKDLIDVSLSVLHQLETDLDLEQNVLEPQAYKELAEKLRNAVYRLETPEPKAETRQLDELPEGPLLDEMRKDPEKMSRIFAYTEIDGETYFFRHCLLDGLVYYEKPDGTFSHYNLVICDCVKEAFQMLERRIHGLHVRL